MVNSLSLAPTHAGSHLTIISPLVKTESQKITETTNKTFAYEVMEQMWSDAAVVCACFQVSDMEINHATSHSVY